MNKRTLGAYYESMACSYLSDLGMQVLKKNYRIRSGEIDIIARDKSTIVFVEVKYRKNSRAGDSLEAINYIKRKKIIKVALNYLYTHHVPDCAAVRFDCVGIDDNRITYVKNAFDITGSVI